MTFVERHALGTIAELRDENRRLRDRIESIEAVGLGVTHRARRSAANAAEHARSIRNRKSS
jgi:hypothetical protein